MDTQLRASQLVLAAAAVVEITENETAVLASIRASKAERDADGIV